MSRYKHAFAFCMVAVATSGNLTVSHSAPPGELSGVDDDVKSYSTYNSYSSPSSSLVVPSNVADTLVSVNVTSAGGPGLTLTLAACWSMVYPVKCDTVCSGGKGNGCHEEFHCEYNGADIGNQQCELYFSNLSVCAVMLDDESLSATDGCAQMASATLENGRQYTYAQSGMGYGIVSYTASQSPPTTGANQTFAPVVAVRSEHDPYVVLLRLSKAYTVGQPRLPNVAGDEAQDRSERPGHRHRSPLTHHHVGREERAVLPLLQVRSGCAQAFAIRQ